MMWQVIWFTPLLFLAGHSLAGENDKHDHSERYQKPGANIRLEYPESILLNRNDVRQEEIHLSVAEGFHEVHLSLVSSNGVEILSETREWFFDQSTDEIILEVEFELLSSNIEQLNFYAKIHDGEEVQTRVVGVSVIPASYAIKKAKMKKKVSQAPKTISLPARENIYSNL